MNGPPHLLGEVSNTSKTAQLKELRRFLFKRKFIWDQHLRKTGLSNVGVQARTELAMRFRIMGNGRITFPVS
jgi:ribosomal protein L9